MNDRVTRLLLGALGALMFAGMLSQQAGPRGQATDVTFIKDDQTATIDCNRNAVSITGDDNKITVKGECTRLTVIGDDNEVKADNVNEVSVTGDDNKVAVNTVATISVKGDDNKIGWKKGAGGKKPEVSNIGDDNDITQD